VRGFAQAPHAPRSKAAAKQQTASRAESAAPQSSLLSAPAARTAESRTDAGALSVTSANLSSFAGIAMYAMQHDGDNDSQTYAAKSAAATAYTWATSSVRSAYQDASRKDGAHDARRHWGDDDSRAWKDNGRHRGHDHSDAARHGEHRAAPASVARHTPAAPSAFASSWTRAVVAHHPDATAVATPSTTPVDSHDPAPSDDTSADTELPGPYAPAAPSTTSLSSSSGPLALASAISDDMPIHEGTPVRAAEATQSVVPAAPVFTTDVSPD
jgi:hypothetical protein